MVKLDRMNYEELLEAKMDIEKRLKRFRPVRIKRKWKRCGKKTCFCSDGPSNNGWGNLHGPYLFAQFVDNDTKKPRLISLGNYYDDSCIDEIENQRLDFRKYFSIDPSEYERLSGDEKDNHSWYYSLTEADYEECHGISRAEDTMDRYDKFYGTQSSYDSFGAARERLNEEKEACSHEWARAYGLGSPSGQRQLMDLLRQDYYLKTI